MEQHICVARVCQRAIALTVSYILAHLSGLLRDPDFAKVVIYISQITKWIGLYATSPYVAIRRNLSRSKACVAGDYLTLLRKYLLNQLVVV